MTLTFVLVCDLNDHVYDECVVPNSMIHGHCYCVGLLSDLGCGGCNDCGTEAGREGGGRRQ